MRILRPLAIALSVLTSGAALAADETIQNSIDTVNKHFEVASKYFGDGVVQLHSRREGENGTGHTVYQFDCVNGRYDELFAGDMGPEQLPIGTRTVEGRAIKQDSAVAPLAQHACTKHGHPLVEW